VFFSWAWVVIGVLWILNGIFFRRFWKKSTRDMSSKWRWFYLIGGAVWTAEGILGLLARGRG
jgi:hypothetical protein